MPYSGIKRIQKSQRFRLNRWVCSIHELPRKRILGNLHHLAKLGTPSLEKETEELQHRNRQDQYCRCDGAQRRPDTLTTFPGTSFFA